MRARLYRLIVSFVAGLIFCLLLNMLLGLQFVRAEQDYNLKFRAEKETPTNPYQPDREGMEEYKLGQYNGAIATWLRALKLISDNKEKANIYDNLASAYHQVGKLSDAIQTWNQAIKIYRKKGDSESRHLLASVLANQAQAYNALGQFRQAIPLLEEAIAIARKNQAPGTEAKAQGILGNAYSIAGDYDQALERYQASLKLARGMNNSEYIATALSNISSILNSRAKKYILQATTAHDEGYGQEEARLLQLAQQDKNSAIAAATSAVQEGAGSRDISEVKSLVNIIHLLQETSLPNRDLIARYRNQAVEILKTLPNSRSKAYVLIDLASGKEGLSSDDKLKLLKWAIFVARNIGDSRAESFALGAAGYIYELLGQLPKAMELTRQAEFAAQQANALDSLYRWQWQVGRIYNATGESKLATRSYKQAVSTLQGIRGDIVTANKDLQFDIRDEVEPVYRQLMALLLDSSQDKSSRLEEVLEYSKLLKLTELQSFFGDECIEVRGRHEDSPTKTNEVVINSLILEQKTYMLLRLPDGIIKSYPVKITAEQLKKEVKQFRDHLEYIGTAKYWDESYKLYDLLIRPMAADLAKVNAKTLVFINDGILRNIPMAALHDGKQFLVEKYAIASTLGLNLTSDSQSQSHQKALIFGLTVGIPPFNPLPGVRDETKSIQNITSGSLFLDAEFTRTKLQRQMESKSYSNLHLATHGEFGGTPDTSFLQAFDGRIYLEEFEKVLRSNKRSIDLMVLSACQTASGDNRATLGLAGVGVRAGVKNVLASLWFVDDDDTVPLIEDFYTELQDPSVTKAEALRKAQLKLIADSHSHPAIWSSFVLIED